MASLNKINITVDDISIFLINFNYSMDDSQYVFGKST